MRPPDDARLTRRAAVAGVACSPLLAAADATTADFSAIEKAVRGRLGVCAVDLTTRRRLAYRADERFAMCSTFKLLLAAAVLARVDAGAERLDRRIAVARSDILPGAPRTEPRVGSDISILELCAAVVEVSDNPGANLLLTTLGGPAGFTAWLRRIGDVSTRLDRTEPALNTAVAGDPRDTTTPAAMAATLERVLAGSVLTQASRARLHQWMVQSPTGVRRLRAAAPEGWRAGDKTGTGANGATNDMAIFWPPTGGPILIAAYVTETQAPLDQREQAHVEIGRAVLRSLGRG